MKPNQCPVHEVAGQEDRRQAQPDPSVVHGQADADLGQDKQDDDQGKCGPACPMRMEPRILFANVAQGLCGRVG